MNLYWTKSVVALLFSAGFVAQCSATENCETFREVINDPVQCNDKFVKIEGVIGFTSAGIYLYGDRNSFNRGDYGRIFKIGRHDRSSGKIIELADDVVFELQGKCVSISGYVDSSLAGHVGGYPIIDGVDLNQSFSKLSETVRACPDKMR